MNCSHRKSSLSLSDPNFCGHRNTNAQTQSLDDWAQVHGGRQIAKWVPPSTHLPAHTHALARSLTYTHSQNSGTHSIICLCAHTLILKHAFVRRRPDYSGQSGHIKAISAHISSLVSDNSSHILEKAMEPFFANSECFRWSEVSRPFPVPH